MKHLMTTVALAALLAITPAAAQSEQPAQGEAVHRNDLPETHLGADLPAVETEGEASDLSAEARTGVETAARGSIVATQFGNLVASKEASGVARNLGDVMILLHSGINQQLDAWAERTPGSLPETMSKDDEAAIEALNDLNGTELNLALAEWVGGAYPEQIKAWEQLAQTQEFEPLAVAVLDQLEGQLMVAERIAEDDGQIDDPDAEISKVLSWGHPSVALDSRQPDGPGQTDERQHTPDPEAPEVQSGENYRHEQVEIDLQTATRTLPSGEENDTARAARPAGELSILNAGGLLAALENPDVEIDQLGRAGEFEAKRVRVVAVETAFTDPDVERISDTAGENQAARTEMRDALSDNDVVTGALSDADAGIEDVTAFDVLDEGIVIYTLGTAESGPTGQ